MLVTRETFDAALALFQGAYLTVDCETTGLHPYNRRGKPKDLPVGWSVRSEEGKSAYFPLRHAYGENIEPGQAARLYALFAHSSGLINHNVGFDENMARADSPYVWPPTTDTYVGAALFNEHASKKLKVFAARHLDSSAGEEQEQLDKLLVRNGLGKSEMWRLHPQDVAAYACRDVELAAGVDNFLRQKLYKVSLYEEMSEFSQLLAQYTRHGVLVDQALLRVHRREAREKASEIKRDLSRIAGFPFNPNSPAHVKIMFQTKDSTWETLSALNDPRAEKVIAYRSWTKSASFYDVYEAEADEDDYLHGSFNSVGTKSSRISHSNPNLGQVPRDAEEYKQRECFIAPPGHVLVEADFSQAEPRMLTHYTGDPRMTEIFQNNLDLHQEVANDLQVSRQTGKTLNLAILYGIGSGALAALLKVNKSVAQSYLKKYFERFPSVRDLQRKCVRAAERDGYISLYTGRRCHFEDGSDSVKDGMNRLVQGGVGEMVRRKTVELNKNLPAFSQRLQVHDSILGYVDEQHVDEVCREIQKIMEDNPWCLIDPKVDIKVGTSWGTAKKWKAG